MIATNMTHSRSDVVRNVLQGYAGRGVFRGFSAGPVQGGKATFRMTWHYHRTFELVLDPRRHTLRFPRLLPDVTANSSLYRELKQFVHGRHDAALPEHRRIDRSRAEAKPAIRQGVVSLTMKDSDDDYEYATRKLIHLVQEIFLTFLANGSHLEYLVEAFDLDPDHM
jgi:hypothetical protein